MKATTRQLDIDNSNCVVEGMMLDRVYTCHSGAFLRKAFAGLQLDSQIQHSVPIVDSAPYGNQYLNWITMGIL